MAFGRSAITASAPWALAVLLAACGAGAAGGDGVGPARDFATVSVSPVIAARTARAGEFAADYLRGTHFTALAVEVGWPEGRPPAQAVLDLVRDRLTERCDKPDGVEVELGEAIPAHEFPPAPTFADLGRLEDAHRRVYSDEAEKTAAMYVLLTLGESAGDEVDAGARVLGAAYRGGSVAVFLEAADQGTNPFGTTDEMVGMALVHEVGHLLGLVNRTVPAVTDHEDPAHPGHDVDPTSVMFWYTQVPRVVPNLGDPDFAQFGAASIADLRAFGGR